MQSDDKSYYTTHNKYYCKTYPAGVAGVLGELVLDCGAESVLESGRGLLWSGNFSCNVPVFKAQTGFFTTVILKNENCNYYRYMDGIIHDITYFAIKMYSVKNVSSDI